MRGQDGFTLIELMVVIIIIGILVAIGIPQFTKTMETSKATDAASLVNLIAAANRNFALDHPSHKYANGQITTDCNSVPCGPTCTGATPSGCCLVACKYLAAGDFNAKPYDLYAVGGVGAGSCGVPSNCEGGSTVSSDLVACAKRKPGSVDGGTDAAPYNTWGYAVDKNGIFGCYGTDTPAPPR